MARKPERMETVSYVAPAAAAQQPAATDADVIAALATADADQTTEDAPDTDGVIMPADLFIVDHFSLNPTPRAFPDETTPGKETTVVVHATIRIAGTPCTFVSNISRVRTPVNDANGAYVEEEFRAAVLTKGRTGSHLTTTDPTWQQALTAWRHQLAKRGRDWYDQQMNAPEAAKAGTGNLPRLVRRVPLQTTPAPAK